LSERYGVERTPEPRAKRVAKSFHCNDGSGSPCEEVAPATGVLGAFVGLALDVLDDSEKGPLKRADDFNRDVKVKIEGHLDSEEILDMYNLIAYVEGDENERIVSQDAAHLAKERVEGGHPEVDDGVEQYCARQASVASAHPRHVLNAEIECRIERFGDLNHRRRQVEAVDRHALIVEVSRDMARPAAEIGNHAALTYLLGEAIQEMTVQGFALEFPREMLGVCGGCRVIACEDVHWRYWCSRGARAA
jgi:hypothetical protein